MGQCGRGHGAGRIRTASQVLKQAAAHTGPGSIGNSVGEAVLP